MVVSAKLTGGSGHTFQHRVAASYLVRLLCRGFVPFLRGGQIRKIILEAAVSGAMSDDVLVEGVDVASVNFKLAIQVKRNCKPLQSDDDFKSYVTRAWLDWNNVGSFNQKNDRFILIASFKSSELFRFSQLLEQARATLTSLEFERRLPIKRFVSSKLSETLAVVKTLIGSQDQDQIWKFLRSCDVSLSDLDEENQSQETELLSLLASNCMDTEPRRTALETWDRLQTLAGQGAGVAREFNRESLPEELKQRHTPVASKVNDTEGGEGGGDR